MSLFVFVGLCVFVEAVLVAEFVVCGICGLVLCVCGRWWIGLWWLYWRGNLVDCVVGAIGLCGLYGRVYLWIAGRWSRRVQSQC